jgi:lon-related putative ATP-dependent protease
MTEQETRRREGGFRNPLTPDQLYRTCDPTSFDFQSTSEVEPLDDHFGQERAVDALRLGLDIRHRGYNMFLLGSTGLGKHELLEEYLNAKAGAREPPDDCCYVNNFDASHKPVALRLPAGRGCRLREDMIRCIEDLIDSITATFQSDEYQARLQEMGEEYSEREQKAFRELDEKARQENITLVQTPQGYTLAPVKEDKILSPAEFEDLPEDEKKKIQEKIDELKEELKSIIRQLPALVKEGKEKLKELNREFSQLAIDQLFADLRKRYEDLPAVVEHIDAVKADVVENVDAFRQQQDDRRQGQGGKLTADHFPQYHVNVLVDNSELDGAPVIYEDNPTFMNLVGRIEHVAIQGTLTTNFTLLKPGALHQANGGYLVLDAVKVLTNPFAWETLKRTLRAREIRIQSLEHMYSFASTVQLEPEPIPLNTKVVLTGDRHVYYLLEQYDPEFSELFKIAADMSEDVEWNGESTATYPRLIRTLQDREEIRPLDRSGVARVIEHSARQVQDNQKLSLHMGRLTNLLCESDHWAEIRGSETIAAEDVQKAVDAAVHRLDQFRERSHESILRDIMLVDTTGERVAQVNGLSVYQLGDYSFGKPTRITATARLGSGRVLDIEREVKLGGRIHSKGVMIISSFLANRFARDQPLPLSATLAFEQSYGGVEGDSASVAELTALLSALSRIPVRQYLAVTGSVNQHGQVQAIGGVNEKIEGFFDICRARGLAGGQGVVIPRSNLEHLMLRDDVIEAVAAGRFHVYAVATMDEALELLMGQPAGTPDDKGDFPADSINGRVMARVRDLVELSKKYSASRGRPGDGDEGDNDDD